MNTVILGTGSYLPSQVLTSQELGDRLGVGEQWILDKTGIVERRVAAATEVTSDLGAAAAEQALKAAGMSANDIDIVIVTTSTPDQPVPATACFVQAKLGATRAAAFDIAAGCTGYVHAISVAHALLKSDVRLRNALIIGVGLYSRFLNYTDKRTCVLFGDGAGAVVLGKAANQPGILACRLASDGTLADIAQIPAGGTRMPATAETVATGQHFAAIHGGDIRRLAVDIIPRLVSELLRASGCELRDVDLIIPHQANGVMLDEWIQVLGIDPGLMHRTVGHYGNTGAASIPITLDDAQRSGRLSDGDLVLAVGIGAGVTWGGFTLRWCSPSRTGT